MKKFNKLIGNYGEDCATEYLIDHGYKILQRNYKCPQGEIDIICSKGSLICFTEVKTRYEDSFGLPCESVNRKKQMKIKKTSIWYISEKNIRNINMRYDIIEVYLDDSNEYKINLLENAFF